MLSGRKLALTLTFTVLVALAFGVSCKGFFQPNTLTAVTIQPPTVNLGVGAQQSFTAYGTFQDGTRSQLTSGVVWTSDSPEITITAGGDATALAVTSSATITGSAQGLSGTATVTVVGDVTNITVSPTSASMTEGETQNFTFAATPGPPNYITSENGGTLTITSVSGASTSDFNCTVGTDDSGNPTESCTAAVGASTGSPYQLVMTYPSSTGTTATSPTVTVTVSP
jgi:hypothetical protein